MDGGDRSTRVQMYLMSLNTHLKMVEMVNFILYVFCHNFFFKWREKMSPDIAKSPLGGKSPLVKNYS